MTLCAVEGPRGPDAVLEASRDTDRDHLIRILGPANRRTVAQDRWDSLDNGAVGNEDDAGDYEWRTHYTWPVDERPTIRRFGQELVLRGFSVRQFFTIQVSQIGSIITHVSHRQEIRLTAQGVSTRRFREADDATIYVENFFSLGGAYIRSFSVRSTGDINEYQTSTGGIAEVADHLLETEDDTDDTFTSNDFQFRFRNGGTGDVSDPDAADRPANPIKRWEVRLGPTRDFDEMSFPLYDALTNTEEDEETLFVIADSGSLGSHQPSRATAAPVQSSLAAASATSGTPAVATTVDVVAQNTENVSVSARIGVEDGDALDLTSATQGTGVLMRFIVSRAQNVIFFSRHSGQNIGDLPEGDYEDTYEFAGTDSVLTLSRIQWNSSNQLIFNFSRTQGGSASGWRTANLGDKSLFLLNEDGDFVEVNLGSATTNAGGSYYRVESLPTIARNLINAVDVGSRLFFAFADEGSMSRIDPADREDPIARVAPETTVANSIIAISASSGTTQTSAQPKTRVEISVSATTGISSSSTAAELEQGISVAATTGTPTASVSLELEQDLIVSASTGTPAASASLRHVVDVSVSAASSGTVETPVPFDDGALSTGTGNLMRFIVSKAEIDGNWHRFFSRYNDEELGNLPVGDYTDEYDIGVTATVTVERIRWRADNNRLIFNFGNTPETLPTAATVDAWRVANLSGKSLFVFNENRTFAEVRLDDLASTPGSVSSSYPYFYNVGPEYYTLGVFTEGASVNVNGVMNGTPVDGKVFFVFADEGSVSATPPVVQETRIESSVSPTERVGRSIAATSGTPVATATPRTRVMPGVSATVGTPVAAVSLGLGRDVAVGATTGTPAAGASVGQTVDVSVSSATDIAQPVGPQGDSLSLNSLIPAEASGELMRFIVSKASINGDHVFFSRRGSDDIGELPEGDYEDTYNSIDIEIERLVWNGHQLIFNMSRTDGSRADDWRDANLGGKSLFLLNEDGDYVELALDETDTPAGGGYFRVEHFYSGTELNTLIHDMPVGDHVLIIFADEGAVSVPTGEAGSQAAVSAKTGFSAAVSATSGTPVAFIVPRLRREVEVVVSAGTSAATTRVSLRRTGEISASAGTPQTSVSVKIRENPQVSATTGTPLTAGSIKIRENPQVSATMGIPIASASTDIARDLSVSATVGTSSASVGFQHIEDVSVSAAIDEATETDPADFSLNSLETGTGELMRFTVSKTTTGNVHLFFSRRGSENLGDLPEGDYEDTYNGIDIEIERLVWNGHQLIFNMDTSGRADDWRDANLDGKSLFLLNEDDAYIEVVLDDTETPAGGSYFRVQHFYDGTELHTLIHDIPTGDHVLFVFADEGSISAPGGEVVGPEASISPTQAYTSATSADSGTPVASVHPRLRREVAVTVSAGTSAATSSIRIRRLGAVAAASGTPYADTTPKTRVKPEISASTGTPAAATAADHIEDVSVSASVGVVAAELSPHLRQDISVSSATDEITPSSLDTGTGELMRFTITAPQSGDLLPAGNSPDEGDYEDSFSGGNRTVEVDGVHWIEDMNELDLDFIRSPASTTLSAWRVANLGGVSLFLLNQDGDFVELNLDDLLSGGSIFISGDYLRLVGLGADVRGLFDNLDPGEEILFVFANAGSISAPELPVLGQKATIAPGSAYTTPALASSGNPAANVGVFQRHKVNVEATTGTPDTFVGLEGVRSVSVTSSTGTPAAAVAPGLRREISVVVSAGTAAANTSIRLRRLGSIVASSGTPTATVVSDIARYNVNATATTGVLAATVGLDNIINVSVEAAIGTSDANIYAAGSSVVFASTTGGTPEATINPRIRRKGAVSGIIGTPSAQVFVSLRRVVSVSAASGTPRASIDIEGVLGLTASSAAGTPSASVFTDIARHNATVSAETGAPSVSVNFDNIRQVNITSSSGTPEAVVDPRTRANPTVSANAGTPETVVSPTAEIAVVDVFVSASSGTPETVTSQFQANATSVGASTGVPAAAAGWSHAESIAVIASSGEAEAVAQPVECCSECVKAATGTPVTSTHPQVNTAKLRSTIASAEPGDYPKGKAMSGTFETLYIPMTDFFEESSMDADFTPFIVDFREGVIDSVTVVDGDGTSEDYNGDVLDASETYVKVNVGRVRVLEEGAVRVSGVLNNVNTLSRPVRLVLFNPDKKPVFSIVEFIPKHLKSLEEDAA